VAQKDTEFAGRIGHVVCYVLLFNHKLNYFAFGIIDNYILIYAIGKLLKIKEQEKSAIS